MVRAVTLFTGQWADLALEQLAKMAQGLGYDGLELACWGDHFAVRKALEDDNYCQAKKALLAKYNLKVWAISSHLVGQAVCDKIDERHKAILPAEIWGEGNPEKIQKRAIEEMKMTARAAAKLGVKIVNGFTGSSIWPYLYAFPPTPQDLIEKGYKDFADKWIPILDVFAQCGVTFALEVHPTEIAFDIVSAERALKALNGHKAFGFNYDPSHLGYQGVDYVEFIRRFRQRIVHVHMKDVYWSSRPRLSGVFGGHLEFGNPQRYWDFRSLGRGKINFEAVIRALNEIGYQGPLSVEWEDAGMDREQGAKEACAFVRKLDFVPSSFVFDKAFEK